MKAASSDIESISNSQCPTGGHLRKPDEERLIVDCVVCESTICIPADSWGSPDDPPLTEQEKREAAKREKESLAAMGVLTQALIEAGKDALLQGAVADPPKAKGRRSAA